MNMIAMKFLTMAACVALAMAAPMPQDGALSPGQEDAVDFVEEPQLDAVESEDPTGLEPGTVGLEQDPDYYYDTGAADAGGFADYAEADYTEADSNIGHRVERSPARRRGSGRFSPVRRRQFKLGGFRKPSKKTN